MFFLSRLLRRRCKSYSDVDSELNIHRRCEGLIRHEGNHATEDGWIWKQVSE